jgi:hypothetical protein
MFAPLIATFVLHVLPRPARETAGACSVALRATIAAPVDPGALDELTERWSRITGISPAVVPAKRAQIQFLRDASLAAQAYRLTVSPHGVRIASADSDGAFYGMMTLAQLPVRISGQWRLPCATIEDRPVLRWRILSDDISRGPMPSMRYFESRIRTIAAFKMNGYSPYMEGVFKSPTDPLPAQYAGLTPAQLSTLARYAHRFHVAFIPEQQTFAHMHETLEYEQYASAAEYPHGYLLDPGNPVAQSYLQRIVSQELAAVPHPAFFHIGSDETSTLGLGTSAAYVDAHGGRGAVYAQHIRQMQRLIAPSGARLMVWDDGIESDPSILTHISRSTVLINWHYDVRPTYMPVIHLLASAGFDQMVAPGAENWNRFFPDTVDALASEEQFIDDGKAAHVLGLFQTTWHDDGESLIQETWYPVLFAAADAWSDTSTFSRDFSAAFFGTDGTTGFGADARVLGSIEHRLAPASDRLEFADPFTQAPAGIDWHALRLDAERVETDLLTHRAPLHPGAASAMLLAARRYDALGRRFQIAQEVRQYYADATASPQNATRDLYWCKYWFWELRDTDERLARSYARVWRQANRSGHLASNLEQYHLDAQIAIRRADAIDRATYEHAVHHAPLPALEDVLGLAK